MLMLRQSLDVNKRSHMDTIRMYVLRINLAQLWPGLDLPDGLIFNVIPFFQGSPTTSPRVLSLSAETSSLFNGKFMILILGQLIEVFSYFRVQFP